MSNWRDEYPFAPNTFETVQGKIHYVDEGPRQSDESIVCVHGNPTWSFYYRSIVNRFRDSVRCLAIDHLGCGLSEKPIDFDYCLRTHTENLVAWINALDLRNITLVVHDWGGAIGLGGAIQLLPRVRRLLILNTAAFPPPTIPFRIRVCRFPILGSLAIRQLNAFAWPATWMAIDRLPRLSANASSGLLFPYAKARDRVAIDRFVQDIPASPRHRTWKVLEELEGNLHELQNLPITFVWGMKDWCFTPACLRRLQQALPKASTVELNDVGHYVMEEAPDEVCDALAGLLKQPT